MFSIKQILQLRKSFGEVKKRKGKNPPPEDGSLRAVRERNTGDEKLFERACDNLTSNGIRVLMAKDQKEAIDLIKNETEGSEVIVKSKSNVSKELKLTEFLEALGKTVVETDIGDRLIQITGGKPSHPTGPASHLSVSDIRSSLEEYFGRKIGTSPEDIVAELKKDIVSYIEKADIAITGANAISAEEGSILILHNEGNISEIIQRTKKLIVLTGIDKIYDNLEQAIHMVKTLTYNATGAKVPSFINIISGPSKTADIEKKLIKGVHNPREVVLILMNGKRKEIAGSGFREALYCIGCGTCLIVCPMYNVVGDRFGYGNSVGGMGLILSYLRGGGGGVAEPARLCMTCYRCKWSCPVDVNIPKMIWQIRAREHRSNVLSLVGSRFVFLKGLLKLGSYRLLCSN